MYTYSAAACSFCFWKPWVTDISACLDFTWPAKPDKQEEWPLKILYIVYLDFIHNYTKCWNLDPWPLLYAVKIIDCLVKMMLFFYYNAKYPIWSILSLSDFLIINRIKDCKLKCKLVFEISQCKTALNVNLSLINLSQSLWKLSQRSF